jgi:hypothetical protein
LIQNVEVVPAEVEVVGSQRLLDRMETLYTAKVPVDGLKESGNLRTGLALVPASLRLAPNQDSGVQVRFKMRPRRSVPSP